MTGYVRLEQVRSE